MVAPVVKESPIAQTLSPETHSTDQSIQRYPPTQSTLNGSPSQEPKVFEHITTWPDEGALPQIKDPSKNVSIFIATKWFGQDFDLNVIRNQCSKDIQYTILLFENKETPFLYVNLIYTLSFQEWCSITTSPNESATADAVFFHNRDFNQSFYPKERTPSQVYVMLTVESPMHEEIYFLPDQINWTLTYRRDSDIQYPYVIIKKKEKPETVDYDAIWNMKNQSLTAAWLVSNCGAANKRKEIAEKAQREGLSLDIFGDCGKPLENCGRFIPDTTACKTKVMKNYKFYVVFENSNCPDYITEKIYYAFHLFYAIPIVLQRKNYENNGVPSNSFIALDDFTSIRDMVTFMNNLQNDKQRYLEYHKWRESFMLGSIDENMGMCGLCRKLRSRDKPHQSYSDLRKWYSKETCDTTAMFRYL